MKVIPAIDIKGGKVVRLVQGAADKVTVYSDSPLDVARKWAEFGVEMIHVVDLDGAMEGVSVNLEIVRQMAHSVRPLIELGGGMRDEEAIRKAIDAGVEKVVIGTKALDEKFLEKVVPRYASTIVAGVDARQGMVYTKGWVFETKTTARELVGRLEEAGIRSINYTDISKDGMLGGPDIESLKKLLKSTYLDVVAAGGISTIDDVKRLKSLEKEGLKGIIIGKALYEARIDLAEAIKVCSQNE